MNQLQKYYFCFFNQYSGEIYKRGVRSMTRSVALDWVQKQYASLARQQGISGGSLRGILKTDPVKLENEYYKILNLYLADYDRMVSKEERTKLTW